MKGTKMQKGITLIALIITIIVLLILAVVAISAVSNSGIITYSKDAQEEYEKGKEKEKVTLAASEAYLAGQGKITEENLRNALDSNFGTEKYSIDTSNSEYFKVKITEPGREYKVYKNGKVEGSIESNTDGGDDVTPDDSVLTETYVTSISGLATGVSLVEYENLTGKIKTAADTGKITAVITDGTYQAVIPAGFTVSTIDGEDSISGGLVIRDKLENEFVWVPVTEDIDSNGYGLNTDGYREPDVVTNATPSETVDSASGTFYDGSSSNLEIAECTEDLNDDGTINAYDFKIQLTNEYKLMAESINKYDGFYVGRYETSMNGTNPQSKASTAEETITSATDAADSANMWYGLYALNRRYSTSSVAGTMMWGSQYDAMMNWMGSAAGTTIPGKNTERTCGTAPDDVIKNVYDLYGSCYEWTLEAYSECFRIIRGGNPVSNTPGASDLKYPHKTNGGYSSRLALYIL